MSVAPSLADRIQRLDLFTETWNGVRQKLERLYAKESQVVFRDVQVVPAGNPDEFESLLMQKNLKFELPVIVVNPTNFDPNDNSYNRHILRRNGVPVMIDKGREWWTVVKATPVLVTFQVMMVSDDLLTMLRMAERWMSNETWGIQLNFEGLKLTVQILPDKNLGMPARAPNSAGSEQYRLVTNLKAATYAGYAWLVPAIRIVQLEALFPNEPLETSIEKALESGSIDNIAVMNSNIVGPAPPPVTGTPEFEPVA